MIPDVWAEHAAYEAYIGRWSRRVAAAFVPRLGVAPGRRWLDVGCGTGALAAAVLAVADPAEVIGVDPSLGFLTGVGAGALFCAADARALPFPDGTFDAVVSGLALNFVPDPTRAAAELARVARPGAVVAAYVWDYADGMQMLLLLGRGVRCGPGGRGGGRGPALPPLPARAAGRSVARRRLSLGDRGGDRRADGVHRL